ncbi:hypothetical protein [Paenibacillus sp. NEAU-GSW1]|uniref:hypothetical protein n=1 Tax=Paenibacillus sp. NEAU-GSW1 TaxID=2682486 RepID=UPI00156623EF|nr:hypothetical protein [Paenibacillus sp. NEAU-GSW1]
MRNCNLVDERCAASHDIIRCSRSCIGVAGVLFGFLLTKPKNSDAEGAEKLEMQMMMGGH